MMINEGMFTLTIFAHKKDEVEKDLKKLERKATRCGVGFSYEFGEIYAKSIQSGWDSHLYIDAFVIDVTISRHWIKRNGYKCVAQLQHFPGDVDNVVTCFEGKIDQAWFTLPPRCDHCGTNRYRKVTFLVENEEGNLKQVGSSCLKEYTGIDPAGAIFWAEASYPLTVEKACYDPDMVRPSRVYGTERVIGLAIDSIKRFGYVKSSEPGSTKSGILESICHNEYPSEEAMEKAEHIVDWLVNTIDKRDDKFRWYELESNCIPFAKLGYVEEKNIGYLAYIPVAYDRYIEREMAKQRDVKKSSFVGIVGEKVEAVITSGKLVTSWLNDFGVTNMYKFTDFEGNIYIWKTAKYLEADEVKTLKGTIKEHSEYNGEKQTVLTRCKVA